MSKKATIRTRKRGKTYSYSFDAGKNPVTGKRKMIEKGGYASEQEAYDAGVAAYADWKSGNIGITSERIKLCDYLNAWLENVARPTIRRTTYGNYYTALKVRIIPQLGELYLQDLRPRDVDMWVQQLAARGFSKGTIATTKMLLSHALRYAVYPAELIASNPSEGIKVPRSAPEKIVSRTIISPQQFQAILRKYNEGHKYHILFLLAYHTGARIGELLGLSWEDVNFQQGYLDIKRQIVCPHVAHCHFFAKPKTTSGERRIFVDDKLLNALRRWRVLQSKNELQLGAAYQIVYEGEHRKVSSTPKIDPPHDSAITHSLICSDQFGLPIKYSAVRYVLGRFGLNAHSFRHTHATMLIEAGAKPVDVAERLGHIDAAITQNLYTHNTEEMQRETAAIFGNLVDRV